MPSPGGWPKKPNGISSTRPVEVQSRLKHGRPRFGRMFGLPPPGPLPLKASTPLNPWKAAAKDKKRGQPIADDRSSFVKFFRETIEAETVLSGIPPGTSWEELEKKGIKTNAQVKKVRGKLNVPRERFRRKKDGTYVWAEAA